MCFAELLSLSQEVLSLFGHLLQTITAAVKARQDACTFFNGKKVRTYVVAEDLWSVRVCKYVCIYVLTIATSWHDLKCHQVPEAGN